MNEKEDACFIKRSYIPKYSDPQKREEYTATKMCDEILIKDKISLNELIQYACFCIFIILVLLKKVD